MANFFNLINLIKEHGFLVILGGVLIYILLNSKVKIEFSGIKKAQK